MNEEVLKIRNTIGYEERDYTVIVPKPLPGEPVNVLEKEQLERDYGRLSEDELSDYIYKLNSNMTTLKNRAYNGEFDEKEFINLIIENIYNVLKIFSEMNIFPGYFFRKVFEMNDKYYERKRDKETGNFKDQNGLKGDYRFFYETNLSSWVDLEIKKGLDKGYHHVQMYPKSNISDAFTEILGLFQKYNFSYRITTKEECKKAFDDISINYSNIMSGLTNSDYVYKDIEYLCRILYDYVSFFVAIGVNPKKYLDEYIEKQQKEKSK